MSQSMNPGDACTWLHVPRGGYGHVERVPAVIERVTALRVVIKAKRASGVYVTRTVRPESLRLRCAHCHGKREAVIRDGSTGLVREVVKCDRCDERGEVSAVLARAAELRATPRRNGGG